MDPSLIEKVKEAGYDGDLCLIGIEKVFDEKYDRKSNKNRFKVQRAVLEAQKKVPPAGLRMSMMVAKASRVASQWAQEDAKERVSTMPCEQHHSQILTDIQDQLRKEYADNPWGGESSSDVGVKVSMQSQNWRRISENEFEDDDDDDDDDDDEEENSIFEPLSKAKDLKARGVHFNVSDEETTKKKTRFKKSDVLGDLGKIHDRVNSLNEEMDRDDEPQKKCCEYFYSRTTWAINSSRERKCLFTDASS